MQIEYRSAAKRSTGGDEARGEGSGDEYGALFVNDDYRYAETITPGTGLLNGGHCDAVVLLAAGTVTGVMAEPAGGGGASITVTLAQGIIHKLGFAKITASSTTVTALWHRQPT